MPDVLDEMGTDLAPYPLSREFVVFKKSLHCWGRGQEFVYHTDEHSDLENTPLILINHRLITNITYNNTPRYLRSAESRRTWAHRDDTRLTTACRDH
jgi:hypothetical protein